MTSVGISEFRRHLLRYLARVEKGETLVVTTRGKQLAVLSPPEDAGKTARKRLAAVRKTAKIGDVLSPIQEDWEAAR